MQLSNALVKTPTQKRHTQLLSSKFPGIYSVFSVQNFMGGESADSPDPAFPSSPARACVCVRGWVTVGGWIAHSR